MTGYLDDDENVKAMRETARTVGLTALLIDIARSTSMKDVDATRLIEALRLLGVSDSERTTR